MFLWTSVILTIVLYVENSYGTLKICYTSSLDTDYKPEYLDATTDYCDQYVFAYAWYNEELNTLVYPPDTNLDLLTKLMELKENCGKSVILGVGGIRDSKKKYLTMLSDPERRQTFAKNVVEFVKSNGYNGLDLQLIYPTQSSGEKAENQSVTLISNEFPENKQNFVHFVRELRDAINFVKESEGKSLKLGISTDADTTIIDQAYAVSDINMLVDWIACLLFELSRFFIRDTTHLVSVFEDIPEVVRQRESVTTIINYWIDNGANENKIVLVAQLYGLAYTLLPSLELDYDRVGAPVSKYHGALKYYQVMSTVTDEWTTVSYGNGGSYATHGLEWISLDLLRDVERKAKYVKDMDLLGIGMHYINYDCHQNAECPSGTHYEVLKAVSEIIEKYQG